MTRTLRLSLTFAMFFALASQGQARFVVYSQPNEEPDGLYSDGVEGQWASTRSADNFLLTNPSYRAITELTWWGSSDLDYVDPTEFISWVVVIYDDVEGLPGPSVYEEEILTENIAFIPTGNYTMNDAPEYEQTAALSNPPTLFIDRSYWISIGAIVADPGWDAWIWSLNYSQGDGLCAQDYFDGAGYGLINNDVAFVLIGEPAGGCPRAGASGRGCTADIDGSGDCQVTLADLAELLGAYGTCPGDALYNPDADLADDGNPCINLADLAELLGQYGDDCSY
ncbi:MAG: hypothetical protein KKI02_10780 [Planctomycetes bacterium]|nr:hypothetical protein [Planctomycetota bacterium]